MLEIKSINRIMDQLTEPWKPIDVTQVNDQVIRIALFNGDYPWHKHTNEDELFYVLKGKITVCVKNQQDIVLNEGEMVVIPKNTIHSPQSAEDSYVLMFEPFILQSKGD